MSRKLSISLFQIPLAWNMPLANKKVIENYLESLSNIDIVVLPETFTTGFAVTSFTAETMQGDTVKWMLAMAKKYRLALVGSLFIAENNLVYNRMIFATPNKELQWYDKWHLFGMGNEAKLLAKGTKLPIFSYKNWKIKPLICYDLRFPVTTRNTENYDLIICIANWPQSRIEAWDTLLKARAIENLCYVVGVNRIGKDANALKYTGHSNVYDPTGKALLETSKNESVSTAIVTKNRVAELRDKFPFLNDRDRFIID